MKKTFVCPNCKSNKLLVRDFSTGVIQLELFGKNEDGGFTYDIDSEKGKKVKIDICADCGNVYCHEAIV